MDRNWNSEVQFNGIQTKICVMKFVLERNKMRERVLKTNEICKQIKFTDCLRRFETVKSNATKFDSTEKEKLSLDVNRSETLLRASCWGFVEVRFFFLTRIVGVSLSDC